MVYRVDEAVLADAKSRLPLSALIRGEVPLRKEGAEWKGCCPFHKERSPSFYVYDDHYHCYGCGAHGDHVSWLMQRQNMTFVEASQYLIGSMSRLEASYRVAARRYEEDGYRVVDYKERGRVAEARAILAACQPIKGTLAEKYLRQRGITAPLPPSLMFHPGLVHREAGRVFPCLVAVVHDSRNVICAIQRTYLDPLTARKAAVPSVKKSKGPLRDGAVRLGEAGRVLGIAEGTETGLSAKQRYSLPVWVALGMQRMRAIRLPPCVEEVMIFRDSGEAAKQAAIEAAEVWEDEGRTVMIEAPPAGCGDMNDFLRARVEA